MLTDDCELVRDWVVFAVTAVLAVARAASTLNDELERLLVAPPFESPAIAASTLEDESERLFELELYRATIASTEVELWKRLVLLACC